MISEFSTSFCLLHARMTPSWMSSGLYGTRRVHLASSQSLGVCGWVPKQMRWYGPPQELNRILLLMGLDDNQAHSFSTPSELGCPSTPSRTGPILPLDNAEGALMTYPVAILEPSGKLPNQTHHLTSGQAETSGLHLRHTGTKGCLETRTHTLPPLTTPQRPADFSVATHPHIVAGATCEAKSFLSLK